MTAHVLNLCPETIHSDVAAVAGQHRACRHGTCGTSVNGAYFGGVGPLEAAVDGIFD